MCERSSAHSIFRYNDLSYLTGLMSARQKDGKSIAPIWKCFVVKFVNIFGGTLLHRIAVGTNNRAIQ